MRKASKSTPRVQVLDRNPAQISALVIQLGIQLPVVHGKAIDATGLMVLVADWHGVIFNREFPVVETGDDFPHYLQQVFVQCAIMPFHFVKPLPVLFRYRAGKRQVFRGRFESFLSAANPHHVSGMVYREHVVLAGFFVSGVIPPHLLSFLESHCHSIFYYSVSSIISIPV